MCFVLVTPAAGRAKANRVALSAALLIALTSALAACGDDDAGIGQDGGISPGPDSSVPVVDGDVPDDDAGGDSDDDDAGGIGTACDADDDCDDLFCNGIQRCIDARCETVEVPRCTNAHPCVEELRDCECADRNADHDGFPADECIPPEDVGDCDDSRGDVFPGAAEVCDALGVDEDCDPETFSGPSDASPLDGDRDGDGVVSAQCFNNRPAGGTSHGEDCDDEAPSIHPGAREICNYKDDDCNGLVDEERPDDGGPAVPYALQGRYYPDVDGDGFGNEQVDPTLACALSVPAGFVPETSPDDCDDEDPKRNDSALELCDGSDNDCDGAKDAADTDLFYQYNFPSTDLACMATGPTSARWEITECPEDLLWCTPDVVQFGCTTDATTLINCRECGRECTFACGDDGCDEVDGVALGSDHSCAITREGTVACWGYGAEGRIGNGYPLSTATPSEVLGIPDAVVLAAGPETSCAAVGDARQLYCWGTDAAGLLANDEVSTFSAVPVRVATADEPTLSDIETIAIASSHACVTLRSGALYCWGTEADGRLGNDSSTDGVVFPTPAKRDMGFRVMDAELVVVGELHGCIITRAGTVECWGDNTYGQLGDPDYFEAISDIVRPVPNLSDVTTLAANRGHTCAVSDGEVFCWGLNDHSQLGRESGGEDGVPLPVEGLINVSEIAVGPTFSCALHGAGEVSCWGSNASGERGNATAEDSAVPTPIEIDDPVIALSAGALHACALTAQHVTYCWGDNALGQLGTGEPSNTPAPIPQPIKPLERSRR